MVMVLRTAPPEWDGGGDPDREAKCRSFRPDREKDDWFGDGVEASMEEAIYICTGDSDGRQCPLRAECLRFALINNEHYGVWGGTTPEQRWDIRRRHKEVKKVTFLGDAIPFIRPHDVVMAEKEGRDYEDED